MTDTTEMHIKLHRVLPLHTITVQLPEPGHLKITNQNVHQELFHDRK